MVEYWEKVESDEAQSLFYRRSQPMGLWVVPLTNFVKLGIK
jgi:hypothetical protein